MPQPSVLPPFYVDYMGEYLSDGVTLHHFRVEAPWTERQVSLGVANPEAVATSADAAPYAMTALQVLNGEPSPEQIATLTPFLVKAFQGRTHGVH